MGRRLLLTVLWVLLFNSEHLYAGVACEKYFVSQELRQFTPVYFESLTGTEKQILALSAKDRFNNYFAAVGKYLKERNYVIDIIQVALIAKEHVLLMGPPGNAKSMISDIILGNIKEAGTDELSYYKIQMTPETTMSETHGPLDYVKLSQSSKYERIYQEGMLMSKNVFVDEIFDSRSNALRNLLVLMNERAHAQGPRIIKGRIETIIAATNTYISEVYEAAGNDKPKAVIDRFAFSIFVPGDLEMTQSAVDLIQSSKKTKIKIPELTFQDLDKIRALVSEVEIPDNIAKFLSHLRSKIKEETEALEQSSIQSYREKIRNGEDPKPPYRATKYQSPRTLNKAGGILKAIVVSEWLKSGGTRPLRATMEDVKLLEMFFTLNGPRPEFIDQELGRSVNNHEKVQLMGIKQEREIFNKYFDQINSDINSVVYGYSLLQVQAEIDAAHTHKQKEAVAKKLIQILIDVGELKKPEDRLSDLSGTQIGLQTVEKFVTETLQELLGNDYQKVVVTHLAEIEHTKKQIELEKERKENERLAEEKKQQALQALKEESERKRLAELEKKQKEFAEQFKDPSYYVDVEFPNESFNKNVDLIPGTQDIVAHTYVKDTMYLLKPNGSKTEILRKGQRSDLDFLFKSSPTYFKMIGPEILLIGLNKSYYVFNIRTLKVELDFVLPSGVIDGASIYDEKNHQLISIEKELGRIITTDLNTGGRGTAISVSTNEMHLITNFNENKDMMELNGDELIFTSQNGMSVYKINFKTGQYKITPLARFAQTDVYLSEGIAYAFYLESTPLPAHLRLTIKDAVKQTPVAERSFELANVGGYTRGTAPNAAVLNYKYAVIGSTDLGLRIVSLQTGQIVADEAFGVKGKIMSIRMRKEVLIVSYNDGTGEKTKAIYLKDHIFNIE